MRLPERSRGHCRDARRQRRLLAERWLHQSGSRLRYRPGAGQGRNARRACDWPWRRPANGLWFDECRQGRGHRATNGWCEGTESLAFANGLSRDGWPAARRLRRLPQRSPSHSGQCRRQLGCIGWRAHWRMGPWQAWDGSGSRAHGRGRPMRGSRLIDLGQRRRDAPTPARCDDKYSRHGAGDRGAYGRGPSPWPRGLVEQSVLERGQLERPKAFGAHRRRVRVLVFAVRTPHAAAAPLRGYPSDLGRAPSRCW